MSVSTDARQPGLRERKKIKLRRTIRAEALRLFEAQGYEQTTVEQIAEAAETSTTTFYRYFPTKEDVVLDDDYDRLMAQVADSRPADEPLATTIRAVIDAVMAEGELERDQTLTRLRLMAAVPALDARYAADERSTRILFARLLAGRTGRSADDFEIELTAAALVAVLFTASRRWAAEGGKTALSTLAKQALAAVDPLLARL